MEALTPKSKHLALEARVDGLVQGSSGVQIVDALVDLPAGRLGRLQGDPGVLYLREEDGRLFGFVGTLVPEEPAGGSGSWEAMAAYAQFDQGDGTTIVSLEIPPDINVTAYATGLRAVLGRGPLVFDQYTDVPSGPGGLPLGHWGSIRQDVGQPAGAWAYIVRMTNEDVADLLHFELQHTPF